MRLMTGALAAAIGAGAMVTAQPAQASFDDQFVCEGLGDTDLLVIISSQDSANATLQITTGIDHGGQSSQEPMRQIPGGSGMKYAGLGIVFHAKGNEAILETEAGSVPCRFAGESAEEDEEIDTLDIPGRSYGGKLRAGPGMDFDQIASLEEGDAITILANTNVAMNGYDWFLVQLPDGRQGYQWGGLLCSDALHVIGIYGDRDCPTG